MTEAKSIPIAVLFRHRSGPQLFVPLKAEGAKVLDNGGDVVADCISPEVAEHFAALINDDAFGRR